MHKTTNIGLIDALTIHRFMCSQQKDIVVAIQVVICFSTASRLPPHLMPHVIAPEVTSCYYKNPFSKLDWPLINFPSSLHLLWPTLSTTTQLLPCR